MLHACLPNDEPLPEARQKALAQSQAELRYSYAWPPEIAVAAEVPKAEGYSHEYMARILGITADIFRNLLPAADLFITPAEVHDFLATHLDQLRARGLHDIKGAFFEVQTEMAHHMTGDHPKAIAEYGRFYSTIDAPPAWRAWDDDRCFVWQRIAGANPMVLRRLETLPDHVAVDEQVYARSGRAGSLAATLAEGRLFACDYGLLAGVACGTTNGKSKWLPAPYALFASERGSLFPIAIQAGAARESPVYTPRDGDAWRVARLAVQTADASLHELVAHLGRTHLVMEAVALAAMRQLALNHPLRVLLAPHFEFTLAINNSAATSLIAKGGAIDLVFGSTIEASAAIVKKGLDAFELPSSSIEADMAARGLDDPRTIAEHPYRDDGRLVWSAIRRFADAFVRHYYRSDAAVAQDPELAAFVRELGANDGGRLRGIRALETVTSLAELMAIVVWTGSAQHAAVNFPQFPYMSALPNMAGAFWAPWPVAGAATDEATLLSVLPPYNMAALQHATVYQLSSLRVNRLGHYPIAHFRDRAVHAMVDAFNAELKEAEKTIAARDRDRPFPYPFLLPSAIPASIHI